MRENHAVADQTTRASFGDWPHANETCVARRALLAGAAAGLARAARADDPDEPADVDPASLLTRLVRRVTLGIGQADVALARSIGYEAYLERHLAPDTIDDSALQVRLADQTRFSTLTMTYQQMLSVTPSQCANECVEASILRAAFSNRQLYERMVEFWSDHFNIEINFEKMGRLKPIDDRSVIRPNALGTFRALLEASARSPAMLMYLNNDISTAGNPNENYARELLELHTLGVNGGYTQQDVVEVARCLTGWTIHPDSAGALAGTFRFDPAMHDTGPKVVLGHSIPARSGAAGQQDGQDVLDILLDHPSTARFIASKLCRWLLGENAPSSVVRDVESAYVVSNGDIKEMIRAALRPNHFAAAAPKYKRPWHVVISALRSLSANVSSSIGLRWWLTVVGQTRFGWPTPDGYPDETEFWVGLILPRWNFGADLLAGAITGASVDTSAMFLGLTSGQQIVARMDELLCGGEMSAYERERILTYMQPAPTSYAAQREALGLIIGCPTFQWY